VCRNYSVAALITEPILQNIGIVKPLPGYLEGLRRLADRYGFVLVFDEVKTGFRHALGGYAAISGVYPDLAVYGKAIANGYPISVIGGKRELMDFFAAEDLSKRVLLAGTYNAHPIPTAAAIATIERLAVGNGDVYRRVDELGGQIEAGIRDIAAGIGVPVTVARQGSAFCAYFADHAPVDWHDLAASHDFLLDEATRREAIRRGVYVFPLATKQCSLSAAHTGADIEFTLTMLRESLEAAVSVMAEAR
jgi:glutamate-1-semialdehyde 2,1-aminomutase